MTDSENTHSKWDDTLNFGDSDVAGTEFRKSQRWMNIDATDDTPLFGQKGEYFQLFDPSTYENDAPSVSQGFRGNYLARGREKFLQKLRQKWIEELLDLFR